MNSQSVWLIFISPSDPVDRVSRRLISGYNCCQQEFSSVKLRENEGKSPVGVHTHGSGKLLTVSQAVGDENGLLGFVSRDNEPKIFWFVSSIYNWTAGNPSEACFVYYYEMSS